MCIYFCLLFRMVKFFKLFIQFLNVIFNKFLLIYLVMVMLGLHCCLGATVSLPCTASHWGGLSCWGPWVLGHTGFRSCSTWTLLPCSMWDLPSPGIEPLSLALADGFLTTGSPGIVPRFLKVTFHLQLLQNVGYVPHTVHTSFILPHTQ